jgi:uncharacterized membrane protein
LVNAHAQRFENVLADSFAGMGNWYRLSHNITFLMVVISTSWASPSMGGDGGGDAGGAAGGGAEMKESGILAI